MSPNGARSCEEVGIKDPVYFTLGKRYLLKTRIIGVISRP